MGVGGSTSRPNSGTITSTATITKRPHTAMSTGSSAANSRSSQLHQPKPPSQSCCSHFKENHAGLTRTVTPANKDDTIDDEIEEIVANTLDLVSNNSIRSRVQTPNLRDTDRGGGTTSRLKQQESVVSSGVGQRRILRSGSVKRLQRRPSLNEIDDLQYDAKEIIPGVDFAKFKKVNQQGATMQNSGRIIHHQESDLLWRLGLISPEAYTITSTGTRSAPSNQGAYLKTPSYDLTEEQLMANIEKEFECTI